MNTRNTMTVCGCVPALVALFSAPAFADAKAEALIQKAEAAARKARTLRAEMVFTRPGEKAKGTLRLMKPNYAYVALGEGKDGAAMTLASDGKHQYFHLGGEATYTKGQAPSRALAGSIDSPDSVLFTPFFEPARLRALLVKPEYAGTKTINGRQYELVKYTSARLCEEQTLYFGPNGFAEGWEQAGSKAGTVSRPTMKMWLRNLRIDVPLTAEQFIYTPREGTRAVEVR